MMSKPGQVLHTLEESAVQDSDKAHELKALIVRIKYLNGEICLQLCDGADVPQWMDAGQKVTLLVESIAEKG
jgi:hypothetical protein